MVLHLKIAKTNFSAIQKINIELIQFQTSSNEFCFTCALSNCVTDIYRVRL